MPQVKRSISKRKVCAQYSCLSGGRPLSELHQGSAIAPIIFADENPKSVRRTKGASKSLYLLYKTNVTRLAGAVMNWKIGQQIKSFCRCQANDDVLDEQQGSGDASDKVNHHVL